MLKKESMPKEESRKRMHDEWAIEVNAMEAAGNVILMSPCESYFLKDKRPDKYRIVALWTAPAESESLKEREVCVLYEILEFFRLGYGNDLVVRYELDPMPEFEIRVTALCQYDLQDLYGKLPPSVSNHIRNTITTYGAKNESLNLCMTGGRSSG